MGWKNWPYWLKGGVIFVIFNIILSLLLILLFAFNVYQFNSKFLSTLIFPGVLISFSLGITKLCFSIFGNRCDTNPIEIIFPFLLNFIIYFIIGALIGFIYGKIKSRGEK